MSNTTFLCPVDRRVMKGSNHCPDCHIPMINMGKRWRAPTKSNTTAWKKIQAGDYLWEHDKSYLPNPDYLRWFPEIVPTRRVKRRSPFPPKWANGVSWAFSKASRERDYIRDEILRRMA